MNSTFKKLFLASFALALVAQPVVAMDNSSNSDNRSNDGSKDKIVIFQGGKNSYNSKCCICLEEPINENLESLDKFKNKIFFGGVPKKPVTLECKHMFCSDCMQSWRNSSSNDARLCPICKQSYVLPEAAKYQMALFERKFGKNWPGWLTTAFPFSELFLYLDCIVGRHIPLKIKDFYYSLSCWALMFDICGIQRAVGRNYPNNNFIARGTSFVGAWHPFFSSPKYVAVLKDLSPWQARFNAFRLPCLFLMGITYEFALRMHKGSKK